jgi:ABC-type dipeptide/oligopeptide/nickel transport system ATPase component
MASKTIPDTYGLIIVGNSGVGKSFLANLILGRHHFKHDFSARSVTHRTESTACILGDKHFRIYNIPGLIEGNEERIVLNRHEISRAFEEQKDNPLVIIYVFGHQNGRIRNEDIATFRSIHNAYTFCPDSLITIVNGLPPDRPNTYNEDTQTTLIELLGMKPSQMCFIDHVKSTEVHHESIQKYLIDTILNVHPRIHTKINNINLITDDVLQLQADLDMIRIQMEMERCEHEDVIINMEREYEAAQRLSGEKIL